MQFKKKYEWPEEHIQFLYDNWQHMTQRQIGEHLKIGRESIKDKLLELGMRKAACKMEWTNEEEQFLLDHFETHCYSELTQMMKEKFPGRNFNRGTIRVRLAKLKLRRTEECQKMLMGKISPSKNFDEKWIARCIAGRKMHLYESILNNPQIIELKRQQLILNRIIQNNDTDTKTAVL